MYICIITQIGSSPLSKVERKKKIAQFYSPFIRKHGGGRKKRKHNISSKGENFCALLSFLEFIMCILIKSVQLLLGNSIIKQGRSSMAVSIFTELNLVSALA
jgi:hypothetical protein